MVATPDWLIAYALLGAAVGVMAGLLGVGGGAVMVPVLTALFLLQGLGSDSALYIALGTSMASIVLTSISSMLAHSRHDAVLWPVVKAMAPGIVLGTLLATFIVPYIETQWLAWIFTLFIVYVSVQMLLNRKPRPGRVLPGRGVLASVGAGIGGFSALVSIGGGTLTTPFLLWSNVGLRQAIGTSAAAGVPISIAGAIGYAINGRGIAEDVTYLWGFLYLPAIVSISLCSVFFAPLGARLAHTLPLAVVRKLFTVLLIALALNMLRVVLGDPS